MFYDPLWMDGVKMDIPIYIEGPMSYIAYDHPLWLYAKDDNDRVWENIVNYLFMVKTNG